MTVDRILFYLTIVIAGNPQSSYYPILLTALLKRDTLRDAVFL